MAHAQQIAGRGIIIAAPHDFGHASRYDRKKKIMHFESGVLSSGI